MNLRSEFDLDRLRALSTSENGKDLLVTLTRDKRHGLIMLKDEKLLAVVVKDGATNTSMTLAHSLVLGGNESIRVAISQMPSRILGLETNNKDKVVDFLIDAGSVKVNESLAGNPQALGIVCEESLNEFGEMRMYGELLRVMNAERAKLIRGNCVAHLLLDANPSREIVERISKSASEEVLAHKNGEGISVKEAIEKRRSMFAQRSRNTK